MVCNSQSSDLNEEIYLYLYFTKHSNKLFFKDIYDTMNMKVNFQKLKPYSKTFKSIRCVLKGEAEELHVKCHMRQTIYRIHL